MKSLTQSITRLASFVKTERRETERDGVSHWARDLVPCGEPEIAIPVGSGRPAQL